MLIRHYHNDLLWINPTRCQKQTVGFEVTIVRTLMNGAYNTTICLYSPVISTLEDQMKVTIKYMVFHYTDNNSQHVICH